VVCFLTFLLMLWLLFLVLLGWARLQVFLGLVRGGGGCRWVSSSLFFRRFLLRPCWLFVGPCLVGRFLCSFRICRRLAWVCRGSRLRYGHLFVFARRFRVCGWFLLWLDFWRWSLFLPSSLGCRIVGLSR